MSLGSKYPATCDLKARVAGTAFPCAEPQPSRGLGWAYPSGDSQSLHGLSWGAVTFLLGARAGVAGGKGLRSDRRRFWSRACCDACSPCPGVARRAGAQDLRPRTPARGHPTCQVLAPHPKPLPLSQWEIQPPSRPRPRLECVSSRLRVSRAHARPVHSRGHRAAGVPSRPRARL